MKRHAGILAIGFAFMLVQNYCIMKIPGYFRLILDEISGANRGGVIREHIIYILVYTVLMGISLFAMRKLIIGASRRIEYQLRRDIYLKLLSLDFLFYRRNETGDLMSRCTNDLNQVRTLLGPGVMYIPNSLSRLAFFLPVMIGLSGKLMSILGILMMMLTLLIVKLLPLMRPLFLRAQEAMGMMNNRVWQVITGISTIKRYAAEEVEAKRFGVLNEEYIGIQMAVVKLQEFLRPMFFYMFSLTELVVLYFGGREVINGGMTMGELLQFSVMVAALTFPILALGWMMSLIQQGISALNRVNHILHQEEPEVRDKSVCFSCGDASTIEVKNLSYTFEGDTEPVLHDIDMTIEPDRVIGITGPVGSGKSTLLNILTGLLKPGRGQVLIDGIDIIDIDPQSLHRQMAVVSQEPFLFSRTVAENIGLGPEEMSPEAIRKAAEDAGLAKDIDAFHNGFDQLVGERGITLSGGQKQRVAIARALGKCAPVLVLDDPLSNVDARTEAKILDNLRALKCYRVLIVVSHRISVLKTTDVIYVMDDGTIVESGTHRSLVQRKKGIYSRLAKLQRMEMELEEEVGSPPRAGFTGPAPL